MKTSVSLILTVHDKEFLIEQVVSGLIENASTAVRELIVVFDGCNDASEAKFDNYVKTSSRADIDIVKLHTPDVWETKANNVGLKQSTCEYSIIIQDDMVVTERDFDSRLKKPFHAFEDVFAVTARTAHNDVIKDGELWYTDRIGRENPRGAKEPKWIKKLKKTFHYKSRPRRELFGVRDVVNRGPLMLDNERLHALGYLDEAFAPLDLDDHDLCFRAYKKHGWVCGSYVIGYDSDLDWGQTRSNPKSHQVWLESHRKNARILMERHSAAMLGSKHNENRVLY